MGSCLISTLCLQRAIDHGAHCRLVSAHKTGWRFVEPPQSRWGCHQLAEDDGDEDTRELMSSTTYTRVNYYGPHIDSIFMGWLIHDSDLYVSIYGKCGTFLFVQTLLLFFRNTWKTFSKSSVLESKWPVYCACWIAKVSCALVVCIQRALNTVTLVRVWACLQSVLMLDNFAIVNIKFTGWQWAVTMSTVGWSTTGHQI